MAFTVMNVDQVPEAQRSYGYTGNKGTIQTPHISQLAAEGMVFQTWYSGFHVCSPSRAVMRWATAIWAPAESFPGPRKARAQYVFYFARNGGAYCNVGGLCCSPSKIAHANVLAR